jgi:protein SCO1/2
MMEMTMDFPVRNDAELKGLSIGDQINFNLVVDSTSAYVQDLHRTGHSDQPAASALPMGTPPENPARLQPGDPFPPVELLAESGRVIHLADFRGKAVALTFFFTRCPLPNYCPLMNRNFAATRQLLRTEPGAPRNWQLLSISFKAGFDTPATLMSYASFFRGKDAASWLFASARPDTLSQLAPRIGLMIMGQDASLTHNLRSLIIDPQGRLFRQFNDNLWTPQQLADAMIAAARLPAR